jgi:hypothetical protein
MNFRLKFILKVPSKPYYSIDQKIKLKSKSWQRRMIETLYCLS